MTWEPITDEDATSLSCEGVHTGLRKGAFGDDAHKIWKVIADSKTTDWWQANEWHIDALASMGYRICKEVRP